MQRLVRTSSILLRCLPVALADCHALSVGWEQRCHISSGASHDSMDFPGGSVRFTDKLHFIGGTFSQFPRIPCYRTLDATGQSITEAEVPHPMEEDLALRLYMAMAQLQTMDTLFYEAQRQVTNACCLRDRTAKGSTYSSGRAWGFGSHIKQLLIYVLIGAGEVLVLYDQRWGRSNNHWQCRSSVK
jgi:hypothetical protein